MLNIIGVVQQHRFHPCFGYQTLPTKELRGGVNY